MSSRSFLFQIALWLAFVWFFMQCANPVSPTGGPKDVDPPLVVKSDPPNSSINFNQDKIIITFNEFVKLKNPNQQVLISPPLDEMPDFKIRGKSVVINLNSKLKDSTTYSIFFGDAIVDITEDNPLTNYVFAFSTGNVIDSLSLGGSVVNAFDLKPQEGVYVMLYFTENDTIPTDSLPYQIRPDYITKTDKEGFFRLRNLKLAPYLLFALKDVNSNYLYDQPNEEIAFADSLIKPYYVASQQSDSVIQDTLMSDSLKMRDMYKDFHQLMLFSQNDSLQRILQKEVVGRSKFRLVFRYPAVKPQLFPLNIDTVGGWKFERLNKRGDTLTVWVKDASIDTLELVVKERDSILDTTMFVLSKITDDKKKKSKKKDDITDRIVLSSNAKNRVMELNMPLVLTFANPLKKSNFSNVFWVAGTDTLHGAPFVPNDSLYLTYRLDHALKENTSYEFIFPDSTLYDIYNLTNDSLLLAFKVKQPGDYGNLIIDLDLKNDGTPYIIQIIDSKETVLYEQLAEKSGKVVFEMLNPGKYRIKAIYDRWKNNRWDTGEYLKKRQPENVFYFPAEIQVRANWDVEESWQLP